MSERCEVDTGDQYERSICRQPAPYQARPSRGSEEVAMCPHHAWHALQDGCEVIGPTGNTCRIHDEDGDIYEVSA